MELSELQKKIIDTPSKKTIVLSAAASGKTRVLTEKTRQLLRTGVNPKEIAVITFTNLAAQELRQRLAEDYKDGIFIGTIHSLANYFLLSSGIETDKILNNENFDELFKMVEKNPFCIKHLEWILLDEAQDSDELQFKFLFEMIAPDCFFVCGDSRQAIYQWKGSRPELIEELAHEKNVEVFDMNENYRNGANILAYAKRIIRSTGAIDTSIPMRNINGFVSERPFSLDTIYTEIKKDPIYKKWAILARTNAEVSQISSYLNKKNIPTETFKQGDLTRADLLKKMETNSVKVLTVHSSKGLEFDKVIVVGMRFYSLEEYNICYVAATRARDLLIWMTAPRKTRRNYKS